MEIKEGISVEAYIKNMKELINQLAPISEENQVVTLLRNLSPSYFNFMTALKARDTVTLSYVQQSLMCEEQKLMGKSKRMEVWIQTEGDKH